MSTDGSKSAEDICGSEDNAHYTTDLIYSFVLSRGQHPHEEATAWLVDQFKQYPETKEESVSIAGQVADGVKDCLEQAAGNSSVDHDHVGVQAAVSGAIVVAAKKHWIPLLWDTKPEDIVKVVSLAMHDTRLFFKAAKGELTGKEALKKTKKYAKSEIGKSVVAGENATTVAERLRKLNVIAVVICCIPIRLYKSQGTVRVETVSGEKSNLIFVPDDAHSLKSNDTEHAIFVDWWDKGPNYSGQIIELAYPAGNKKAIRNTKAVWIIIPDIFFQVAQNQLGISLLSSVLETQRKVEVTVYIIGSKVTLFGLALPAA